MEYQFYCSRGPWGTHCYCARIPWGTHCYCARIPGERTATALGSLGNALLLRSESLGNALLLRSGPWGTHCYCARSPWGTHCYCARVPGERTATALGFPGERTATAHQKKFESPYDRYYPDYNRTVFGGLTVLSSYLLTHSLILLASRSLAQRATRWLRQSRSSFSQRNFVPSTRKSRHWTRKPL